MGIPSDPDPKGTDCSTCWPADQTPAQVYVSFEGILPCPAMPAPINEIVTLYQVKDHWCDYEFAFDGWEFWYASALLAGSWVQQRLVGSTFFYSWEAFDCTEFFLNQNVCGVGIAIGHEGAAIVMWNLSETDHSIGSLMHAINMEPEPETKFHFIPASAERACVRFARKSDATNILILVEPTEL